MNPQEQQAEDKYISLEEAEQLLETDVHEIEKLIADGHLTAFRLGDKVLRLRKDQVSELKAKWRIEGELFQPEAPEHHAPKEIKAGFFDGVRDFIRFNDFYIASAVIIAALFYLILSSQ
jgi:excisionase family DNA binding protein